MIAHLNASKPMSGRWLYVVYPLLTAAATLAANVLARELISHPATTGIEFPFTLIGLAGLLLILIFGGL